MRSWFAARLKERVSQAAIGAATLAVASVVGDPAAWSAGAQPPGLALVNPVAVGVVAVLVPGGAPRITESTPNN